MTKPGGSKDPVLTYIDDPGVIETFADSIQGFTFDRHTLRIVCTVTRYDEAKPQSPVTAKQYPVCRLVMSLPGAIDLINQMHELRSELIKCGVMERSDPL